MMVINNNLPALTTYDVVNNTSNQLQKSIQKLSTGLRINSAADDAAGLSISEKMRAQINGLDQAVRNTQDGISLIQTAEGALTETHSILQRMRELSVQAANDTYTAQDRSYIQEEVDLLRDEIDHIGNTTTFNTKKLLNGDSAALWSSDNLNTKAIVNGGLRNIDQFGQKSSAEGNYKITVKAKAGVGEVQKTDIFRIKHDLDPYGIEGSGKFEGAELNGTEAVDNLNRGITITVSDATGDYSVNVNVNTNTADRAALVTALQAGINTSTELSSGSGTVDKLTVSYDATEDKIKIASANGNKITVTDGSDDGVDDVSMLLGETADNLSMSYTLAGDANLNTNNNPGNVADWKFTITVGDVTSGVIDLSNGGNAYANIDAIQAALTAAINADANIKDLVTATIDTTNGNVLSFTSTSGKITFNDSETPYNTNAPSTTLLNNATKTSTLTGGVLADEQRYFTLNNTAFKINDTTITVGNGTTLADKIAADADYSITIDDVVTDINEQLETAAVDNILARKIELDDGTEVVRLFSQGEDPLKIEDTTDATNATIIKAIFGDDVVEAGVAAKNISSAEDSGTLEDVAPLMKATEFKIMSSDTEDDSVWGTISLTGGYEADADLTVAGAKTAAEKLVDDINTKLAAANLDDFKAILTDDGKLQLLSGIRDFRLEANDDVIDSIFGLGTENAGVAEAGEMEEENPVDTVGLVASSDTKLRDLEKFWDSQGNFMLDDPQTITITQGDGQTASITLYKYDTLGDMAQKINDAIANDLGQAKYISDTDTVGASKFATFVDTATTTGEEAVKGTMLIRTIVPGSNGTLNFASKNEDLINALSLNTIQKADDSVYYVTVQDAHTGEIVNGIEDEKITGNVLVGRLHENIDIEFDAQTGITATWDSTNNTFNMNGTYTGADTDTGEITYLHLSDNTMVFQIGANEGDDMGINIGDMRSHALGLDGVLVTDHDSASRSITIIDSAIDKVSTQRAKLGAYQNRLEHTAANLTTSAENLTAAESRIRDTDMAKQMMEFTKLQIMLQAGNSMLAQANQLPQNVLSLIR